MPEGGCGRSPRAGKDNCVMDGGAVTMFVALAVVSIVLGAIFLKRSGSKTDLEWEEDDEF